MFKKIIKYSLFLCLLAVFSAAAVTQVAAAAQQDTEIQRSESVVTIDGESFYVHTVTPGTTFYSLGKLYDISRENIRYYNPHTADGLKAGQVIKIPYKPQESKPLTQRQMKRTFDTHIVNSGETVYSLLQRYNIPLSVLLEDNEGLDPTVLSIGQKLNIRKASQGEADTKEIKEEITAYKEALNSVMPGFEHHLVERGETLYSLSRQNGVSEEIIKFHNPEIEKTGFNYGMIIRIPVKEIQVAENIQPDNAQGAAPARESERPQNTYFRGIKNINTERPLNVVMILPLRGANIDNGQNFADFYRGGLIALEDLKRSGVSVKLDLFNCANSPEEVRGILRGSEAANADLIIGPVYQESFDEVARFAIPRGIVAVSPLALLQGNEYSDIFQVSPHSRTKSDKLREDINESNNVIIIRSGSEDTEFASEIRHLIPSSAHNIIYSKGMSSSSIEQAMSKDKENVFVILSSDDDTVGEILARLTSIRSNLMARSIMNPVIKVVGGSSWGRRFRNTDKEHYFFPLGVRYIATYHADRSNRSVAEFDARYLSLVGSLPSQINPYAYRGYDVVKLFVGNMKMHGSSFMYHLNNGEMSLLGVPYRFEQIVPDGKYQNMEWPKVIYNNDYTITVK